MKDPNVKAETISEMLKGHDKKFYYQLLSRMQMDCDYYLGYGGRNPKQLWANSEIKQIEAMKYIWNSFSENEKPEWLTWEELLNYEKDMIPQDMEG